MGSTSVARTTFLNVCLGGGAIGFVYLWRLLGPPSSLAEGIRERSYRGVGEPAQLLEPMLRSGMLVAVALCSLVVVATLLTRVYRRRPPPRGSALLGAVTRAVPELVFVLGVLLLYSLQFDEMPENGFTLAQLPTFQLFLPAMAVGLFGLGQLFGLSAARAGSAGGSVAGDVVRAGADILRAFPGLVISAVVIIETMLQYPGLGRILSEALLTQDTDTVRDIAIAAVLFVFVCRLISGLLNHAAGDAYPAAETPVIRFDGSLLSQPFVWLGGGLVLAWAVIAIFSGVLAPFDPAETDFMRIVMPPDGDNWLGTDNFGRDVLRGIVYGATRMMPIVAVVLAFTAAVAYVFSWLPRAARPALSYPAHALSGVPAIVFVFIFGLVFPFLTTPLIVCLVIYFVARSVEALTDDRAPAGAAVRSRAAIIVRDAAYVVAIVLAVDFLGFGAQEPDASWGLMLNNGVEWIVEGPWMIVAPAAAAVSLMLGFTLLAHGIERAARRSPSDEPQAASATGDVGADDLRGVDSPPVG